MKTGWTELTADESPAIGTDKAPAGVDVCGSSLLALGWIVMFWTDYLTGCDLN
jgi:hypothetical protein